MTSAGMPDGTPATRDVAEAFSGHRFRETYDRLAPDIVWVGVGYSTTDGKEGVITVCEATLTELADTTTEFRRFLTVADDRTAVVDSIGHYTTSTGATSDVASCDIYEFRGDLIARITSYAVDLGGSGGDPA